MASPQEDLVAARKLIEQCGYWRRKEELEDAEAAAKNWQALFWSAVTCHRFSIGDLSPPAPPDERLFLLT